TLSSDHRARSGTGEARLSCRRFRPPCRALATATWTFHEGRDAEVTIRRPRGPARRDHRRHRAAAGRDCDGDQEGAFGVRGEAMKGADPAVCDTRLRVVGDEIVNRLPGGWHARLWAGRIDEVNARVHRERAGAAGTAHGDCYDRGAARGDA